MINHVKNSYYNKSIKEEYLNLLKWAMKKGKIIDGFFSQIIPSFFSFISQKINNHPNIEWVIIHKFS